MPNPPVPVRGFRSGSRRAESPPEISWKLLPLLFLVGLSACSDGPLPTAAPDGAVFSDVPENSCVVTTLHDAGAGSLRAAIADAACSEITFGVSGTIVLTTGRIVIGRTVSITGPTLSGQGVVISGNGGSRVFDLTTTATASISGVTITGGMVGGDYGGGIWNRGELTLSNSTVSGNSAGYDGGGIYNEGTLTVRNSTVSGNSANYGGGLFNHAGVMNVRHSTITGNSASNEAGGLFARSSAVANVIGSLIWGNTDPGTTDDIHATSSGGSFTSLGHNLVGVAREGIVFTGSDQTGVDAGTWLGPLQDNGGATATHALLAGSPALDAGTCVDVTTDQRGSSRPQGAACDIGAYELAVACSAGSYLDDGYCRPADPGYFVATDDAVEQIACPAGTYQPLVGQTSCLSADPGFFVATEAATAQTACLRGTYQPFSGAASCLLADLGFYVATIGAEAQTWCGSGFTTLMTGVSSAADCVLNTAPSIEEITDLPVDPIPVGTSVQLTVKFTDPDVLDEHTATIKWGDGTEGVYGVTKDARELTESHTYATPGVYTVEVTVSDGANVSDSALYEFVVVYDPDGGFVIGAGWVDVPADSYSVDPTQGDARFGFQARYRRGQTRPDGNTRFQFRAGDMDFRSTSYDWLVVAGARAQYKGEGTINGVGGYCFLLTGIDGQVTGGGGVDRLRLKVWDCSDEAVVFDNARSDSDGAVPPAISRGSIRISR